MTFANLSLPWVLTGLGALGALLFALQQLRPRHRDVLVATTLFWKQIADEAPVRKLRERFRHFWAYLLILAACSLLWLAFAEPRLGFANDDRFHVLVLDGSAGMARDGRFGEAVAALKAHASSLPAERRQVIWSGGTVRTLLNPGEHGLLLDKRLEALSPEAAPATIERSLRQLGAAAPADRPTAVTLFGDAPVRKPVLDLLPRTVTVTRALAVPPTTDNAGITALGISDAASGAWDRVDVFVRVQASRDRRGATDDLRLDVDGARIAEAAVRSTARDDGREWLIADLPAHGGLFTARLAAGDALALDDVARVRLPDKPPLTVLLSPSLAPVLRPALAADPGVRLSDDRPDVVIRRRGERLGEDVPALEFVSAAAQPAAFLLRHPDDRLPTAVLADAVAAIGLTQIDAMSLAQVAQRPIEVTVAVGPRWTFSVWEELLADDFDFTRSRSFPLFVASSIRWLAGVRAWYPYAAAGRPLTSSSPSPADRVVDASGAAIVTLGVPFVPARAGDLPLEARARPLAISLLDPAATTGARESGPDVVVRAPRAEAAATADPVSLLLLSALVLLGAEWHLHRTGRIP